MILFSDNRKKEGLYAKILNLVHVFTLLRFFLYINNIPKVKKYYRYILYYKPFDIVKALVFLLLKLSPLYRYVLKSKFTIIALTDNRGNIYGICHIDVNIKRREGMYGIVIVPSLHGRGLGKILSIYTIMYVFKTFKEVKIIRLRVDVDNTKAIRLYKKLGFVIYAYNPFCDKRNNTWIACYEMVLTKENFLKLYSKCIV